MHFPSLFSKPKPASALVNTQPVVSRPGPTESASLRLAKTYRQRRPSEWEIRACQKEVGWEQLSPNGRLQVQRWLTDLVERCDAAKVTYLFARAIKNDFYVEPELEEQERQLQDQAASASRLTGALVSEQRRVEVLTRQLETLQRAYEGGEKTRDELERLVDDERVRCEKYFGLVEQFAKEASLLALSPTAARQGELGSGPSTLRPGGAAGRRASARHSMPPDSALFLAAKELRLATAEEDDAASN